MRSSKTHTCLVKLQIKLVLVAHLSESASSVELPRLAGDQPCDDDDLAKQPDLGSWAYDMAWMFDRRNTGGFWHFLAAFRHHPSWQASILGAVPCQGPW